jgi:hypothetical protein
LGVYTSMHFGQYSFTIASPGTSDRPIGNIGWFSQYTRGQKPKSPFWYFSNLKNKKIQLAQNLNQWLHFQALRVP